MKFRSLCLCFLLPAVLWANPNQVVEIITLKHRLPAEIMRTVRPLLGPDDALTASGHQLILRTDKHKLEQIQALLRRLDKPLRNLIISVRNYDSRDRKEKDYALSRSVKAGDARIIVGKPVKEGFHANIQDSTYRSRISNVSQVRVIEGQRAFIRSGKLIPYRQDRYRAHPHDVIIRDDVQFEDVTRGFFVIPRIRGNRVILAIQPRSKRLNALGDGSIDVQQAETVASGRLGEWFTLAGSAREIAQDARGIVFRTGRNVEADNLLCDVDLYLD